MEEQIRKQLSSNNELLIKTIIKQTENNKTTLQILEQQKQLNGSLIDHLKTLYEQLDKIPIKTKEEAANHKLLNKILLNYWDYR